MQVADASWALNKDLARLKKLWAYNTKQGACLSSQVQAHYVLWGLHEHAWNEYGRVSRDCNSLKQKLNRSKSGWGSVRTTLGAEQHTSSCIALDKRSSGSNSRGTQATSLLLGTQGHHRAGHVRMDGPGRERMLNEGQAHQEYKLN